MNELVGLTLAGRYRVDAFLGRGGMAEVYKVWDAHRSTFLAMKMLHADQALDRVFLRRFKREAQTLARLQHPNIVRFYGLEQDGHQVFMLMDYVDGESLKTRIFDADGPMPVEQVLEIMRPLCQALQYAHHEGFVHADVKPGNVLIGRNGRPMLSDFGVARMTESATTTMLGAGTPAYMSPEQARGENPTPQSDVYSLGVVLYEMLTGERPFTGEHARTGGSTGEKVRWEQVNLPAPSPRKHNPSISPQLEAVVLKCLEKQPAARYADVLSVLRELESVLASRSMQPATPPRPGPAKPQKPKSTKQPAARRHRSLAEFAAALGIRFDIRKGRSPTASRIRSAGVVIAAAAAVSAVALLLLPRPVSSAIPARATSEGLARSISSPSQPSSPTNATLGLSAGTPATTPDKFRPIDGQRMAYVPAGEFIMGSKSDPNSQPEHRVYLDAFWIDRWQIETAAYRSCLESKSCQGARAFEDEPVDTAWSDAKNYCAWAGARLPTEAEWERAAYGSWIFGLWRGRGEWVGDWYSKYQDWWPAENPSGPTLPTIPHSHVVRFWGASQYSFKRRTNGLPGDSWQFRCAMAASTSAKTAATISTPSETTAPTTTLEPGAILVRMGIGVYGTELNGFYAFAGTKGQRISILMAASAQNWDKGQRSQVNGALAVVLTDQTGKHLASAVGASNVSGGSDATIPYFVLPYTGTYYIRTSMPPRSGDYSLWVK